MKEERENGKENQKAGVCKPDNVIPGIVFDFKAGFPLADYQGLTKEEEQRLVKEIHENQVNFFDETHLAEFLMSPYERYLVREFEKGYEGKNGNVFYMEDYI